MSLDDRSADLTRDLHSDRHVMVAFASRVVGRQAAEDVVQGALESAWRMRDRYDASRGTSTAWLLSLTADQCRRLLRQKRPQTVALSELVHPSEDLVEVDTTLRLAIHDLPTQQRLAVAAYYYLDLPVDQVAEILSCSAGTVKSTLFDARHAIKRRLLSMKES